RCAREAGVRTLGGRLPGRAEPLGRGSQPRDHELTGIGPPMPRMHADELDIDEALVRRLIAERFPEWAARPLRRVEPEGTVNAIFRLGDDLAVRLPRRDGRTRPGGKELEWLPKLAGRLPLAIPVPVAQGGPTSGY